MQIRKGSGKSEFSHVPWRPRWTARGVEELEAEPVLLRRSLDELTSVEQHGTDPLAVLIGLIYQQDAWLQHTPQLGPALQRATDLRERERERKRASPCRALLRQALNCFPQEVKKGAAQYHCGNVIGPSPATHAHSLFIKHHLGPITLFYLSSWHEGEVWQLDYTSWHIILT